MAATISRVVIDLAARHDEGLAHRRGMSRCKQEALDQVVHVHGLAAVLAVTDHHEAPVSIARKSFSSRKSPGP